jgi:hypothetical protein
MPDNSGDVSPADLQADLDTGLHPGSAWAIQQSAIRNLLGGRFQVPQNYLNSAVFVLHWIANAASGDAFWELDYTVVAVNADLDPVAVTRSLPGGVDGVTSAWNLNEFTLAATDGDFATGRDVLFTLARDQTEVTDDLAVAAYIVGLWFQYADA